MDFASAFKMTAGFLEERGFPVAVIGGLAMAAYGMPRTTLDIDFVAPGESQDGLIAFLETQGYKTLHRSKGYSNRVHDDPEKGRIDVVYVRGETSRSLFAGARAARTDRGIEMMIPRPEHLAAMKVFAMKNDPSRTFTELADIRFLLTLPEVDRDEVRGYFARHGLMERYEEIEATLRGD